MNHKAEPIIGNNVRVKAWFDYRAFDAKVISQSSGDFGRTMLLVLPLNANPAYGAAVWRAPEDCEVLNDP